MPGSLCPFPGDYRGNFRTMGSFCPIRPGGIGILTFYVRLVRQLACNLLRCKGYGGIMLFSYAEQQQYGG